jgi:hypothetical protein
MRNMPGRLMAITLVMAQLCLVNPLPVWGQDSVSVSAPGRSEPAPSAAEMITATEGGIVRLGGAEVEIPPGALARDTEIRITRLWMTEDTGDGMRNATMGGGGYRFEPAGTRFAIPATVRMGFDPELTESAKETLYTYYFNTKAKQWERLDKSGLEDGRVVSLTGHFTDMINGTLSLPEGPSPLRFNINSIKGLEAADPSAGVPGREGREGNNTGSASFRIPIALPPGRAGMAPQVAITYSSDGGNGVMGRGFDLQAGGQISTDTRWGVPRFNGKDVKTDPYDRDSYLLDGVRLEEYERDRESIKYRPLREARHEKIERVISGDYWVVTDRRGTQHTYGKNNSWSGRSAGEKYIWDLEEERDVYGKTVK